MPRRAASERKSVNSLSSNHILAVLNTPAPISSSPEPTVTSSSKMVGRRSNVRRSPKAEIPLPVTYTPTTHRISKAKKGKRVHACEFPGCNKVFTRAEHRRRHELNHNPEASFSCTQPGCEKAFHRADLLTRHMERHELESYTQQPQWSSQPNTPALSNASISRCVSVDPNGFLAPTTQQSESMAMGTTVTPGIHPDLANDYSLMWSGVDLPLQPRPSANMFGNQLIHGADSPFYSSPPESCPSPGLSDVTYSLPPHSISSISSASLSVMDQYPKQILNANMTASPPPMHASLHWDGSDSCMPPSNMVLGESLIEPSVQCHYPSPSWSGTDCLLYDDQSLTPYEPVSWAI